MAEPPAAIAGIPGLPPEASARLLGLLRAEPAVQEVRLWGSRANGDGCRDAESWRQPRSFCDNRSSVCSLPCLEGGLIRDS